MYTTMKGVEIYHMVKKFFVEKKWVGLLEDTEIKSLHASGHESVSESATFNLHAGQIKILMLQNDLHLKAHHGVPHFCCLMDTE